MLFVARGGAGVFSFSSSSVVSVYLPWQMHISCLAAYRLLLMPNYQAPDPPDKVSGAVKSARDFHESGSPMLKDRVSVWGGIISAL